MTMITLKISVMFSFLLLLTACQPGAPLVTVLGQVAGFALNESTQILKSKTNKNSFTISGKCNTAIKEIEISFDGGSSYSPLGQFAESSNKNCAAGTFSFLINPNNTIAFDIPADASFKDFKLRGTGDFGASAVLNFRRMVTNSGDLQITAGSGSNNGVVSGSPVVLKARIISAAGSTSSNPNYKFKGSIRIK